MCTHFNGIFNYQLKRLVLLLHERRNGGLKFGLI
jgi:hypothetical protein